MVPSFHILPNNVTIQSLEEKLQLLIIYHPLIKIVCPDTMFLFSIFQTKNAVEIYI